MRHSAYRLLIVANLATLVAAPLHAAYTARPKVRAITALIEIDAANRRAQLAVADAFLGTVRDSLIAAGYEVQTLRVSTQPFPEYTRGLDDAAAKALLRDIGSVWAFRMARAISVSARLPWCRRTARSTPAPGIRVAVRAALRSASNRPMS